MNLTYTTTQVSILNKQATALNAEGKIEDAIQLLYAVADHMDAGEGAFAFGIDGYLRLAKWLQAQGRFSDALQYMDRLNKNLQSRLEQNYKLSDDDTSFGGRAVADIRARKNDLISATMQMEQNALLHFMADLHLREHKRLSKLAKPKQPIDFYMPRKTAP